MDIKYKKILIDFGIRYTKVGFITDSEPMKIIQTPSVLNIDEYFKEKSDSKSVLCFKRNSLKKILELEEFASYIINDILQIYKLDNKYTYYCYILYDLDLKENFKDVYTSFIRYIFDTFSFIASIKIIPKKIFPVFVSGFYSGIILNCGYSYSSITVVNNGLCVFSKRVEYCSCYMQKTLYNLIVEDIHKGKNGNKLDEKNFDIVKKNIIKYMDDFMVRISYILNKKLSNEYKHLSGEETNETNEKENFAKIGFYPDVPLFKIGFNTRIFIGEKLFEENSKNNLAYLILKTLAENVPCEIKKKIGSNIILSGGLTMLEGFYQRFSDEINYISNNNNEFKILNGIKNDLRINKIIYPRNILSWVGASLFLSFNKVNFPGNEINRENKKIDDDELNKIFENLRI